MRIAVIMVVCGLIIWALRNSGANQAARSCKKDRKGFSYIHRTIPGIGLGCLGAVISLIVIAGAVIFYFAAGAALPFGIILLILSLLPLTARYKLTDKELIFGTLIKTKLSLDELSMKAAVIPPYINNQKFLVLSTGNDDWINLPLKRYYGGQDFAQILTGRLGTDLVYKDKRVALKKRYLLIGALMTIYAIWIVYSYISILFLVIAFWPYYH